MLELCVPNILKKVTFLVTQATLPMKERNMLKLTLRMLPFLLAISLAAPALSGTLYKWTGADGSVSFTDDARRIPERFRSQAETIQTDGLGDYSRYTPTDAAAHRSYSGQLQQRLDRLRQNRVLADQEAAGAVAAAAHGSGPETVVRINRDMAVRVPASASAEGPVVVDQVRVLRPGSNFTIHDTVVRQGDKVLMVVRPAQSHQAGPGDVIDERDLFE